jgi:hypothetical protein
MWLSRHGTRPCCMLAQGLSRLCHWGQSERAGVPAPRLTAPNRAAAEQMGCVMTKFKVSDELIDRLSSETGRRLTDQARKGRRRLLTRISQFAVTVTYDGVGTEELTFTSVPTLAQIMARAGDEAFVVAIGMKRKTLRERIGLRLPLAAE